MQANAKTICSAYPLFSAAMPEASGRCSMLKTTTADQPGYAQPFKQLCIKGIRI
jgi:hypothetical protein